MLEAQRAPCVADRWPLGTQDATGMCSCFLPYKGVSALGKGRLKAEPCSLVVRLLYIRDCYFFVNFQRGF